MTKVKVRLTSAPMLNTPGLLRWAMNGYKFKRDRKAMRRVFTDGFDLTDEAADALLSGKVPHEIDETAEHGGAVVFEYEEGKYRRQPVAV